MPNRRELLVLLPSLVAFAVLLAPIASCQTSKPVDEQLILTGATIYFSPTDDPIVGGTVVVQGGKVVAFGATSSIEIPEGAEILDCSGLVVMSGFWNSHVHFLERKWANATMLPAPELRAQLEDMLTRWGYTSVFDTWSVWKNTRALRQRIESGEVPGPLIRSTGEALIPKGGKPPQLIADVLGLVGYPVPEIASEAEATTVSRRLLDEGTDGIKVYAQTFSPPIASLSEATIRAATTEAHRRGKLAFAHPTSREGLMASVRGGVDVVVHTTPKAGRWDARILAMMKERGIALIPTLKLWKYELRHDCISVQERFAKSGIEQLRDWVAVGGTVLFGTDVGYMADYDPTEEYTLMAEAGLSFPQILASLTTAPAVRFGESESLGRIAAGRSADLVVLGGDPSRDVRDFANVRYTIRRGKVIYRRAEPE